MSEAGLSREYDSLGIHFDWWKGEADVDSLIPPMIEKLKKSGIAVMDEGALIVRVEEPNDQKEMPPLILLKSDGAVLYGTTDLATIIDRVKEADPDLILYVVDQRQHGHFEQVFRAARKARLNGRAELEHIGFGTVNGPDGKPFKTRAGGVMKLYDLIAMATAEADKETHRTGTGRRLPGNRTRRHRQGGRPRRAQIRRSRRTTGCRITSSISNASRASRARPGLICNTRRCASNRSCARQRTRACVGRAGGALARPSASSRCSLLALPEALLAAEAKRAPNILCDYVFGLAQAFSRFYTEHHILCEIGWDLRAARLGLCALALTLSAGTSICWGLTVPERM